MVRAIYHDGHLRLLEPVALRDGEEVQVHIESDRLADVVADMLVSVTGDIPEDYDADAVQRELDDALSGKRPLSEIIIEERREGR